MPVPVPELFYSFSSRSGHGHRHGGQAGEVYFSCRYIRKFSITTHMAHFITPQEIKQELPNTYQEQIAACRDAVGNILLGNDTRKLLIVGPCSIHNIDAAQEYARRLAGLSAEVQDVFYIVMRTHFEKPRTVLGWKGLLYDPFLDGSNNLQEGIRLARKLLLFLADLNLAAATEFLEPLSYSYLGDLISWGIYWRKDLPVPNSSPACLKPSHACRHKKPLRRQYRHRHPGLHRGKSAPQFFRDRLQRNGLPDKKPRKQPSPPCAQRLRNEPKLRPRLYRRCFKLP